MEKKKLNIKEIGIEKIVILFLTGIFLLILSVPSFQKGETAKETVITGNKGEKEGENSVSKLDTNTEYITWMEKRLTDTLGQVVGIGKVKAMITLKGSGEKVTLKDKPFTQENSSEGDNGGGTRVSSSLTNEDETVLISETSGESMPYVVKETSPEIEGVVILAEGAGDGKLIQEIVDAVQVLFGVPAHKIKVMKMEGAHH